MCQAVLRALAYHNPRRYVLVTISPHLSSREVCDGGTSAIQGAPKEKLKSPK